MINSKYFDQLIELTSCSGIHFTISKPVHPVNSFDCLSTLRKDIYHGHRKIILSEHVARSGIIKVTLICKQNHNWRTKFY